MLALITALVAPYFIDWGQYRTRFEREASRMLGQPVTVSGQAKARLLPFPSVTFEDVRIGDSDHPLVVADRFSMDLELAPFLSGEILIFDMRLVNPTINLEIDARGMPDWSLPSAGPVQPARVVLESASIINGSVLLHDTVDGRDWAMDRINATVSADSLLGPYRFDGSGWMGPTPLAFRISTGALSRDGFSLRTILEMESQGIELTVDGRMAEPPPGQDTPYTGNFTVRPLDGLTDRHFTVQGGFAASLRGIDIADYRGEFGPADDPYVVTGSAGVRGGDEPSYRVAVTGTQVVLPDETGGAGAAATTRPTLSVSERLKRLQAVLSELPFPPMPGSITVDLPAIVIGDTAIRDIHLAASPDVSEGVDPRRQWKVGHFEAQLPGRTTVEADGTLHLPPPGKDGDETRFAGSLVVASRQPSGLATWLAGSADEAIRRLPNAGFAADVAFSPESQTIDNLELILGPARMRGRVERVSDPDRRSTLDIELAGEALDVDALEALAAVFVGHDGAARYADHDLDISLDLTDPDIRGVKLDRLEASIRSHEFDTEINRLLVSGLFGASVSATGSLTQGSAGLDANADVTLLAGHGSDLIEGLAARFPDVAALQKLRAIAARSPGAFDDTHLNVTGTVARDKALSGEASLSISGNSGGTELTITGTARGDLSDAEKATVSLNASFDNDAAERLFAQAGVQTFPVASPGPIDVEAHLDGSLFDGMQSDLALESGDTVAKLDGVLTTDILSTGFTGQVQVEANDIEPWMLTLGYAFPGSGLGTTADITAAISQRGGKTVLREIDALLNASRITGDLTITAPDGLPTVRGDLAFENLDTGPLYAIITGDQAASIRVADADAALNGEFGPAILPDHDISVGLTAQEVTFPARAGKLTDFSGTLTYRDNEMALRDIAATAGEAALSGTVSMRNEAGLMLVNAQLSAEGAPVDALVPPVGGVLAGKADLALQLTGTGRSNAALVDSLTGAGVLSTQGLTASGVRADGFGELISKADEIGYGITPEQTEEIAAATLLLGETTLPAADYALTVANGEARLANAHAQVEGLTVDLDASATLLTGKIEGDARLSFDPGEEDVAGSQPEIALTFHSGEDGGLVTERDFSPVAGFVTQRALEHEQARVEAMQARLLEKQRLRRDVQLLQYYKRLGEQKPAEEVPAGQGGTSPDGTGQDGTGQSGSSPDGTNQDEAGQQEPAQKDARLEDTAIDPRTVGKTAAVPADPAAMREAAARIFAQRLAAGAPDRGVGPKILELGGSN